MSLLATLCALSLLGAPTHLLRVSSAVSLSEAVRSLAARFEAQHSEVHLELNFGASGELERQIREGAPVDLFLLAATENADRLQARGLLVPASRRDIARNLLVLVAPKDNVPAGEGAREKILSPNVLRIAIGEPRTVPAGAYAMAVLMALGIDERVKDRLVQLGSVRQVLDAVARGEVDLGFVYASDLRVRPGVVEAAPLPAQIAPRIVYPAAIVASSNEKVLAEKFLALLAGPEGRAALLAAGFLAP